jgi:hypothetical protein
VVPWFLEDKGWTLNNPHLFLGWMGGFRWFWVGIVVLPFHLLVTACVFDAMTPRQNGATGRNETKRNETKRIQERGIRRRSQNNTDDEE